MHRIQSDKKNVFFVLLALPCTAMGFALSVQLSALSWILSTQYHLDLHDIGLVWAAGPLAGIIGQVGVGLVSDRAWLWGGRRRPFILIGGVLTALALLALPWIGVIADTLPFTGVLGVALVIALTLDLSVNISFNPTRALIADLTQVGAERTRGYTWMQSVSGSFGVLAYAIGAVWGNEVLIYVGAAVALGFSVLPVLWLTEPRELDDEEEQPSADRANDARSLLAILSAIRPLWAILAYDIYAAARRSLGIEPSGYVAEIACLLATGLLLIPVFRARPQGSGGLTTFRQVCAANAFAWIGVFTTFVYLVPWLGAAFPELSDSDLGRAGSVSFLVFNAVGALVPAFLLHPLAGRFGRIPVCVAAMGSMALGYVGLYAFANSLSAVWAWMTVLGIGWGAMVSLPFAVVSHSVGRGHMGLFMGLFNLSVVLPQLVVSFGVALVVSRAPDLRLIFAISAASLALSTLTWSRVREH